MLMSLVAGVDEAGRGPLAGPVVAAAVILHPRRRIAGLRDSKQLTPQGREQLALEIRGRVRAWTVRGTSPELRAMRSKLAGPRLLRLSRSRARCARDAGCLAPGVSACPCPMVRLRSFR